MNASRAAVQVGCAGWSLAREHGSAFPEAGTHLQRYASRFSAVEINSSFYRQHRPETYRRWAESVPESFRFSVKMPKTITHEHRLLGCEALLELFLSQCGCLDEKLGCILVQLPPSLAYEAVPARTFFHALREQYQGALVLEPRHESWREARQLLMDMRIAQVAADPSPLAEGHLPGGWPGLQYWRLHGAPRIYYSAYEPAQLQAVATQLKAAASAGIETWCIFDNTANGRAVPDAMLLQQLLS